MRKSEYYRSERPREDKIMKKSERSPSYGREVPIKTLQKSVSKPHRKSDINLHNKKPSNIKHSRNVEGEEKFRSKPMRMNVKRYEGKDGLVMPKLPFRRLVK